jgi:ABC-2 type transport system permease protein
MRVPEPVLLVARREITERARDKSFALSTTITLIILLAVVIVPRVTGLGDDSPSDVAVAGPQATELRAALEAQDGAADAVRVEVLGSQAAAVRAVRDGDVDAAIVGDSRILVEEKVSDELEVRLQTASASVRAASALADAGLEPARARAILSPAPLRVDALEPRAENGGAEGLAFVAVIVLYGQILGYGYWVGAGVLEEKTSRIVELLLGTIRARQLLAGKILGIGLLGLAQLIGIAAVTFGVAVAIDAIDAPADALGTIGIVLAFFVLGYAFYACLFAAGASAVARLEELQNAMTPLTVVLVASLIISIAAVNDPGGVLAQVFSVVPPFSAVVMPPRITAGDASAWEITVSVALLLAAIAALVPVAGRIYANSILQTRGRVRLRDAWRLGT